MTTPSFQMEERKKRQQQPVRTDYWLQPNIVVKIITKRLGEKYHKRKGVVMVTVLFCLFFFLNQIIFISHLNSQRWDGGV